MCVCSFSIFNSPFSINMKNLLYLILFMLAFSACNRKASCPPYSWEEDLRHRLAVDFCLTEAQVKDYIRRYIPDVTDEQMRHWEETRALECMVLDGEKRYFRNAGPNLFRIDSLCRERKLAMEGEQASTSDRVNAENLPEILAATDGRGDSCLAAPKRMRVTYTLTVDTNAVPAGEVVRCWLPFPRTDIPRQQDVKLIAASEPSYTLTTEGTAHSTLYMEKRAVSGQPTVFSETFEYTSYGEWHDIRPSDVQPYDTSSELYKYYTSERDRHIVFTTRLRQLADKLTEGEDNPYLKACRIFRWVHYHFPWASAREYSTIDNIPLYVLENGHGDCGQVTLLFVTLCRLSGIPAHFQSGFMMQPGAWNLHDWGEVYFEGIGWVPVDQSFGLATYAEEVGKPHFYLGGIDSWRMYGAQNETYIEGWEKKASNLLIYKRLCKI